MPDAIAAKMCSVCGVDCSAMKRARDARGRYICGDCLERARAAKVAKDAKPVVVGPGAIAEVKGPARVSPDGRDLILDDLLSKSTANDMVPCTECGFPMQSTAILCTHCGFNKDAGRAMRTQVIKAPAEKKQRSSGKRTSFNLGPWGAFFLITGLVLGLAGIGALTQNPAVLLAAYAVYSISGLLVSVGLIVDGFRNSAMSGLIMLAGLFIPILAFYTLWYALTQADETLQKSYLAILLCTVVGLIGILMSMIPPPSFSL